MVVATVHGGPSVWVLLALLALGALVLRFNRPLARGHIALFKGSRELPSWWQLTLLRLVWLAAGVALFAIAVALLFGSATD